MNLAISQRDIPKYCLVFGLVISTFTHLRVGFLGIGELIYFAFDLLGLLALLQQYNVKQFIFFRFWGLYLILAFIGLSYNFIVLGFATGTPAGVVFDAAAYIMLMLSCIAMEKRFVANNDSPEAYLKATFYLFTLLMSFLFALSLVTPSIAGLPLKYHHYFAPLVKNLHQAAMILAPMPFIGLAVLQMERNTLQRMLLVILILMSIVMIAATGSVKAKMGIAVGGASFCFIWLMNRQSKVEFVLAITLAISSFLLLFLIEDPITLMQKFFDDNDGHGSRAYLYQTAISLIKESPIFGRGTGPHIYYLGKFNDPHQTFLAVLLQAGIAAFILFVGLLLHILYSAARYNAALFAALTTIMIYSIGGDILRRLPIWLLLIIIYHVCMTHKARQLREQ